MEPTIDPKEYDDFLAQMEAPDMDEMYQAYAEEEEQAA